MPVVIRVTVCNKDMGNRFPFRFRDKRGKSEPVKEQGTGIYGDYFLTGLDQESIITIKSDYQDYYILMAGQFLYLRNNNYKP